MRSILARIAAVSAALLVIAGCSPPDEEPPIRTADDLVTGLWAYTGLTTSDGEDLPLTGIFLFHDGVFMQQSIFDDEPFEAQRVMAHVGTYTTGAESVSLNARRQIFVAPLEDTPLNYSRDQLHEIEVSGDRDSLTLTFASGTVQTFERLGPGVGTVYPIEGGQFALVDDHFILIHGTPEGTVNGFGTFSRDGDALELQVTRWSEGTPASATNQRDVTMEASFDGIALTLDDGRTFEVIR